MRIHTYYKDRKTPDTIPVSIETTSGGNGIILKGIAPDSYRNEMQLRVLTALQEAGIKIPATGIETVVSGAARSRPRNLDLPVAISICTALYKDCLIDYDGWILTGELHLNGALSAVNNSFEMLSIARTTGKKVFLPHLVYNELTDDYKKNACPADNIKDIINILDKF